MALAVAGGEWRGIDRQCLAVERDDAADTSPVPPSKRAAARRVTPFAPFGAVAAKA
jgi:hypothetical protein